MPSQWPPKKNAAFTLFVGLRDTDGDPITGATGLDSERSIDKGAFADCTNEATEIGTSGMYYLDLTAAEMNGDTIVVQIKSTSAGYKTVFITLATTESTWDEGIDSKALLTGAITTASFAASAINAAALAADAGTEIAAAVWDLDATAHQTGGTFGQAIGDPGGDPETIWNAISARLDVGVSTRASQTSLDTLDNFVDTEVAAIKAVTDLLPTPAEIRGPVMQSTTIATLASQVSFTLTAGSTNDNAYNGCIIVIQDAVTATQKAVGVILDYVGATKTITLLNDPAIFTMAVSDIVIIIANRSLKSTVDNRTLDVSAGGEAGLDWANIGGPTTAQNLSGTNIDVDQVVASVSGAVGSVGAGGITAASIATNAIDADAIAADAVTELQAGLATAAALATAQTDLDNMQTRLPTTLVGGRIDASVGAIAAGAVTAAAIATDAIDSDAIAATAVTEIQTGLATAAALVTAQTDLDNIQTRLPTVLISGRMDSSVGAMAANVITASATAADFLAEINAEVLDVMATDVVTEPSVGIPPATPSMRTILAYMWLAVRNKVIVNATTGFLEIYNDAGVLVYKKALADVASVLTESEAVSG